MGLILELSNKVSEQDAEIFLLKNVVSDQERKLNEQPRLASGSLLGKSVTHGNDSVPNEFLVLPNSANRKERSSEKSGDVSTSSNSTGKTASHEKRHANRIEKNNIRIEKNNHLNKNLKSSVGIVGSPNSNILSDNLSGDSSKMETLNKVEQTSKTKFSQSPIKGRSNNHSDQLVEIDADADDLPDVEYKPPATVPALACANSNNSSIPNLSNDEYRLRKSPSSGDEWDYKWNDSELEVCHVMEKGDKQSIMSASTEDASLNNFSVHPPNGLRMISALKNRRIRMGFNTSSSSALSWYSSDEVSGKVERGIAGKPPIGNTKGGNASTTSYKLLNDDIDDLLRS